MVKRKSTTSALGLGASLRQSQKGFLISCSVDWLHVPASVTEPSTPHSFSDRYFGRKECSCREPGRRCNFTWWTIGKYHCTGFWTFKEPSGISSIFMITQAVVEQGWTGGGWSRLLVCITCERRPTSPLTACATMQHGRDQETHHHL
jgi:hypothetical protein